MTTLPLLLRFLLASGIVSSLDTAKEHKSVATLDVRVMYKRTEESKASFQTDDSSTHFYSSLFRRNILCSQPFFSSKTPLFVVAVDKHAFLPMGNVSIPYNLHDDGIFSDNRRNSPC
jgi:hypothetical protein